MRCFHPVRAFQKRNGEVVFREKGGSEPQWKAEKWGNDVGQELQLRCGNCHGCKLTRAHDWAIRCVHESKAHKRNTWVTLTYDDKNLPQFGDLKYSDFQKFMKRLRRRTRAEIKYFVCGEYGDETQRPHYHACIFGWDAKDKYPWRKTKSGHQLFRSPFLEETWKLGNAELGELNSKTAGYTAAYSMKKIKSKPFVHICPYTGAVTDLVQPFARMSLRQPIGYAHMDKYRDDWYPHGKVVVDGKEVTTPKAYDDRLKEIDPLLYDEIEFERYLSTADLDPKEWSRERLEVQEKVAKARVELNKRDGIR